MKQHTNRRRRAFTLIELMIVVAIVGILAAIAIPNFTRLQAASKQAEARSNLKALFTCAKAESQVANSYDYNAMACFRPEQGNRYHYRYGVYEYKAINNTVSLNETNGENSALSQWGFTATAVGNVDTDTFLDEWAINDTNQMANGLLPAGVQADDPANE